MQLVKFEDIPTKGYPLGMQLMSQLAPTGDRGLNFGRSRESGISIGKIPGYWTCPYNGTITAVYLNTNQGGYRVKFWKNTTRVPAEDDSINHDGIRISEPSTHVEIFNLSDFLALDVLAGDTLAVEIVDVDFPVPNDISGSLLILKEVKEE